MSELPTTDEEVMKMDAYFVRVYTLHNGRMVEPNAIYESCEQAEADLPKFRLHAATSKNEDPKFDLSEVAHAQIEKRYCPRLLWTELEPREA